MSNFINIGQDTWQNKNACLGIPNVVFTLFIETRKSRFNRTLPPRYAVVADKTNDNGWRNLDVLKFFGNRADAEAYLAQLIGKLNKEEN